jgi:hypothetical protein
VNPEQKEEKLCVKKFGNERKQKKKKEKRKNCRTVYPGTVPKGSETVISNNGYALFIADLHCSCQQVNWS